MSTTTHPPAPHRMHPVEGAQTMTDSMLLRPSEAARALAISERKLWELTKTGEISCVRIGRSVRYAHADLLAWIDAKRQEGGS